MPDTYTGTTILLVEDEAIIALAETAVLEDAGFRVETARTGASAVEHVRTSSHIGLVLMDIDLGPGIDGTNAAVEILALRNLPIVFLTSHSEKEMVDRVKGITRYGYVLKNSGEFVLVESVTMALELFRAHLQATEREARIRRLNRTYTVLGDINKVIVRFPTPEDLFAKACRIIVERGEFVFAWVGRPNGDRIIDPVASYGTDSDYLASLVIDLDDPTLGNGPTGLAYKTATRIVVNDLAHDPRMAPWKTAAMERGFFASAAFPICISGSVEAVMSLYAPVSGFFDDEEICLLEELATEIGFALEVARGERLRAEAEQDREHWQQLMQYVVRHDPNSIVILNRELRHLFVSDRFVRDYGVEERDIIGKPHYEVFPDIPERWRRVHARALRGEIVGAENDRLVREDGTVEETRWECRPWYDPSGEIGGIVLYTEIITEHRRTEREHDRVLATLQSLLKNSPDQVSIVDTGGRYRMVSGSVADALGLPADEILGKRLSEVLPPATASLFEARVAEVIEAGTRITLAETIGPGEANRTHRTSLFPVRMKEDAVSFVGVISVDLTDEIRMRKALEESEARWQFAIEGAGDGVWDWNARSDAVVYSRQWKAMLGYAEDEVGDTIEEWRSRVHPDDLANCMRDLNAYLSGETREYRNEHRLRCRDGSFRWVLDRGIIIERTRDGRPLRITGTHADIDARKRAEIQSQLLMKQRELAVLEGHHRVKNDMQIVHALLSLQAGKAESSEAAEALEEAAGRVNVMARLYETIYRGGDQARTPDATEFIARLADEIAARFGNDAPEIRVTGRPVPIGRSLSAPIGTIVNELVTNAMKYAFGPDQAKRTVCVTIDEEDGIGRLVVHDNGKGMPDAVLRGEADGLGMTIIKAFVEQLEGVLSLSNDPVDGGATVEIRFRAADPDA